MPAVTVLLAGNAGSWGWDPKLNKQCQFLSSGEHWHGAPAFPASSL